MLRQGKAVRQIFHLVDVGQVESDFITQLDLELGQAIGRCLRCHVHRHLVALALDARLGQRLGAHREIGKLIGLLGLDDVTAEDDEVVRLTPGGMIGSQTHLVAGNIDQLLALAVQRPHWQETVLGELVANTQPLAVGLPGFRHGGIGVARLVGHVQTVNNVLRALVAGIELDGGINIPFHHLAIEEQGGVGVATAIEGGMQGTQANFNFGHHGILQVIAVQRAIKPLQHTFQINHGGGG